MRFNPPVPRSCPDGSNRRSEAAFRPPAPPTHNRPPWVAWLSCLAPLAAFVFFARLVPGGLRGEVPRLDLPWVPSLGIRFALAVDGLALLFALIITAVGFLIAIYASRYFHDPRERRRFYPLFYGFMAAMLGLVLADDLILLFVFWEVTTLISFLLIGFTPEDPAARRNARQALLVTGAGGLCLLVAVLLMGRAAGTYSLSGIIRSGIDWPATPWYPLLFTCLLAGAFTKSAQFPFHFWLPNAMSAPTPISAFLHSATMVKAGLYLLARLHPAFGGTPEWMATLVLAGGVTALLGAVLSLGQKDMKKVLAYTTVMALGIVTMFLGGRTPPALTAAVTFLLVHALYKSSLFLVVGIVDHAAGTRDLDRLGGLLPRMPFTGAAALTAALSMAGFPLFLGFVGKEIMYKGALTEDVFPVFATAAALLSNAMMTAVAAFLTVDPFIRRPPTPWPQASPPREAPALMWAGPLVLGATGLVFGIIPAWVGEVLVEPAVTAFHPATGDIQLKLWHGFNLPLLLSMATLTLGAILFYLEVWVRETERRLGELAPIGWDRVYDALLAAVARVAGFQTRLLQSGSLYAYLLTILGTLLVLGGAALWRGGPGLEAGPAAWGGALGLVLAAIMTAAALVVTLASSRLLAICGLGVVGAGTALFFLASGAPDVALTQLLVETLTLVFVALVLLRLPPIRPEDVRPRGRSLFDALVAAAVGGGLALLLAAVTRPALDRSLTRFFEAHSLPAAFGRNIVNVILVDFRGLDTLGEITVVALAGLAGYALVRGGRRT